MKIQSADALLLFFSLFVFSYASAGAAAPPVTKRFSSRQIAEGDDISSG
jgi:hypothetical protein